MLYALFPSDFVIFLSPGVCGVANKKLFITIVSMIEEQNKHDQGVKADEPCKHELILEGIL